MTRTLHVRVARVASDLVSDIWQGIVSDASGLELYRTHRYYSYRKAELIALRYVEAFRAVTSADPRPGAGQS